MLSVIAIPAFETNYIWAICETERKTCVIVDPGDAEPVHQFLKDHDLTLSGILITHKHRDHTGGVETLINQFSVPVYGPTLDSLSWVSHPCHDQETIHLESISLDLTIMDIPAHTLEHIAFYAPKLKWLFCGDTLFAAGCGYLFEGTHQQMYDALQKLVSLPEDTLIYSAHEYTVANLEFARTIEPNNFEIQSRLDHCQSQRAEGKMTLPSNIPIELRTNPFLRCDQVDVRKAAEAYAKIPLERPIDVFTVLRDWKNKF